MRHRWLIENPIDLLKAPDVPHVAPQVYTGIKFGELLIHVAGNSEKLPSWLIPALALQGFGWFRTSELVKLYAAEDVLKWEDVDWKNKRIHVRASVGKATKRKAGNERFVPITDALLRWIEPYKGSAGPIVPVMHVEFSKWLRLVHQIADVQIIHNGLRRSAISHWLAANPDAGIAQLSVRRARRRRPSKGTT